MSARACSTCRYWSEMLAQSRGGGPVHAVCLAPPDALAMFRGKYISGAMACMAWAEATSGAIDAPGTDPERYNQEIQK